jgi:pyruvate,orthophosphate dikinase
MIPLVTTAAELEHQAALVRRTIDDVLGAYGMTMDYLIGTMIETPRAALTAAAIAVHADFFSFGTNDLTQTTFALSRDDSSRFLPKYITHKILPDDPFQVLDRDGVGQLVKMGVSGARGVKPGLKVGICGEHGGEPKSIAFCHEIGLDYVSCSPFRVPIARLAAAQASIVATARAEKQENTAAPESGDTAVEVKVAAPAQEKVVAPAPEKVDGAGDAKGEASSRR